MAFIWFLQKVESFFKDVITDDTDNGLSVQVERDRLEVLSEGAECDESDDDVEVDEDKNILIPMGVRRLF